MTDPWNPEQYEKFLREREQPFFDLLGLIRPASDMRVVDLGCGTGKLTRILHERLHARETIGIDRSPRMLEGLRAAKLPDGLRFEVGDIEAFPSEGARYDLVVSNAALHWVEHHDALVGRLASALQPNGQLAVQMPAMHDDESHRVAAELVQEEPYRSAAGGWMRPQPVLAPEAYARLLFHVGFAVQTVRVIVYPHLLDAPEAVVEWFKGTLLAEYSRHLPADLYARFLDEYRRRLLARIETARPFFFPFKRILMWAQRPGADH